MRDHHKLRAFALADELVIRVYQITHAFPRSETYVLSSQMRRAAISVTSNIVEGCSRESQIEFHRFLEIAFGSLKELNYQFNLACRLNYIGSSETEECLSKFLETERVLGGLMKSMRNKSK